MPYRRRHARHATLLVAAAMLSAPAHAQRAPSPEVLQGGEWRVLTIDGDPVLTDSRANIAFADGRAFGSASCNRFTAGYAAAGQSLTVDRAATTMMACAEPLMEQERRFLELLGALARFRVAADGTLVLETADGRAITARRD